MTRDQWRKRFIEETGSALGSIERARKLALQDPDLAAVVERLEHADHNIVSARNKLREAEEAMIR